jgi:hypothetical protein
LKSYSIATSAGMMNVISVLVVVSGTTSTSPILTLTIAGFDPNKVPVTVMVYPTSPISGATEFTLAWPVSVKTQLHVVSHEEIA